MIQEKEQAEEKYLSVETEEEFHEALKRGHPVELPHELAARIGVSFEDVGELGDIIEAQKDACR